MSGPRVTRNALMLALAMSLAGCSDGAGGGDVSEKGATGNQVEGVLTIEDGDESLLGSVNLPRPDWMPQDMPLPQDAHIYLATHIPRNGEPDLYMVQAKSLVDAKAYADAFFDWAKNRNLNPELNDKPGAKTKLVGFTGAGDSPAMTQVISRDGYRDIIITFAGPL
ncbi:MAG: hypothetical protein ACR2PC_05705 [Tsuneonella suprasediminis]|uniref:Uncharacterized protein n=1 Tax=Tsuneonella suprasediminis TaxID=2306996 RepID=A0A419QYU0_9SPHN|nr:hypothetical protein [Tsuneonella suprasediminis]RJX65978.1 hypothetical protein D6858_13470 [Tsuneonella suprasediminis]